MKDLRCLVAFALASCSFPAMAAAQQEAPPPGATARTAESGQIGEIVVTAQRREQRLQDVPLSVSVVSADTLLTKGVSDLTTLSASVPGLEVPVLSATAQPYIRGVGSNGGNPNDEPSVAIYVDGIYIAAPFGNTFSFNNIQRIEVLKGPQGTLFGRNATGGVIQVVTRDPSHETHMEVGAGYSNYDTISADGYVTTGLGAAAAIDLAVQYNDQRNGFGRNVNLGIDTHKSKDFSVRSKLLFEPGPGTRIVLAGDYNYQLSSMSDYSLPPGVLGLDGKTHYPGRHDTDTDIPARTEFRTGGGSLRIEQDLGFAQLTSLTAYRVARAQYNVDADTTPTVIFGSELVMRQKNWSQELQLSNAKGSSIDWLIGGFYFKNEASYDPARLFGAAISAVLPYLDIFGKQKTRSWSIYGQSTVEILPNTNLTGGLRYTNERQTLDGAFSTIFGTNPAPRTFNGFKRLTWRVALDHKLSQDVKVYASYNRGIKSGGFALASPGGTGYKPELVDAYEAGLKSAFLDRRLQINLAAFYNDYKDIQVTSLTGATVTTLNAAGAHIKGFEAEFIAKPIERLTLSGGLSILDGKYTDFPNPIGYPASGLQPPIVVLNAKGNRTIRSPKFTGNFSAEYVVPTQIGDFALGGNIYHNAGYFFDAINRLRQRSYDLLSLSLRWQSVDEHFSITVWGKNLTDSNYLLQGNPTAFGDNIVESVPRTYGVTLRAKM